MRTIGYSFGLLCLVGSAVLMVWPRLKFDLWERAVRDYVPSLTNVTREYTGLSDQALRWLYSSYMVMGALMIWLSKQRD